MPLVQSLEAVLRSLRGPSVAEVNGVFGEWNAIVGALVARHVRPVLLDRGVLTVEVSEPAWATQFQFLSGEVSRRICESVGPVVERVEIRVARPAR